MIEEVCFEGTVENIVFQNNQNGYCIFGLSVEGESLEEIVATGIVPSVLVGDSMKVTGTFVVHPTYGKQLKINTYEKSIPSTEDGMEKYLSSGVVKGVREKLAKKIVEKFGKYTFEVIENHPHRLAEIKGITLEKALTISAVFHEQAQMRRILLYLQNLGISNVFSMKIYKLYKDQTIEKVQSNPYCLADDVLGIGFKIADSIAQKAGIAKDSPFRIESGIKYVLNLGANDGHVYLPLSILRSEAFELLGVPIELIDTSLAKLQLDRSIWQEKTDRETIVYLNSFFYAENNVAKKLVELSDYAAKTRLNIKNEIAAFEKSKSIKLAEGQKNAVTEAMEHGVLIITGGPGTGKTTTINTIISILQKNNVDIVLAAPTGRAAKRMSDATGMEAKTIHRLLEISFLDESSRRQTFGKNKENPIEADIIIVDECSMVDILLMNSLLSAIEPGTRLLLVGDVDQLPSVGPGNVLKDIIMSDCLPVVRLTEIYRQSEESAIIMNAHRINNGEYPIFNEKIKDFFFVKKHIMDDVVNTITQLVAARLPKYAECDPIADIQVLTPMRKSPLGVTNLNQVLQQNLNPPNDNKREWNFRSTKFREGDKVMQIKNNYNMGFWVLNKNGYKTEEGQGVFNGDTGIIKNIDMQNEKLSVIFDENRLVEYDFSQLDELELSYAITIHKSQGSEYKVVVIPVHSGSSVLMSRNLLYTAVTRAKELTVLVGTTEMLNLMINNKREINRYSALNRRIGKMKEMICPD